MTDEQAIKVLTAYQEWFKPESDLYKAIEQAIRALKEN